MNWRSSKVRIWSSVAATVISDSIGRTRSTRCTDTWPRSFAKARRTPSRLRAFSRADGSQDGRSDVPDFQRPRTLPWRENECLTFAASIADKARMLKAFDSLDGRRSFSCRRRLSQAWQWSAPEKRRGPPQRIRALPRADWLRLGENHPPDVHHLDGRSRLECLKQSSCSAREISLAAARRCLDCARR